MKSKFWLLCFALFISLGNLKANYVNKELAARVAVNFYYQAINAQQKLDYNLIKISDSYTLAENGINFFYVFNIQQGGFVIVSANDARSPILAYSFENNYSTENPSPEFLWWMEGYKNQIKNIVTNNIIADFKTKNQWEEYLNYKAYLKSPLDITVGPLILSRWNQGFPFNLLCPQDAGCSHVLVGCVAVAMGQLMNYYKFPLQGVGESCYNSSYGNLCSHYGDSLYNWNAMPNQPNGISIPLASFLYQCGISVEMMYGCTASGSYSHIVPEALKNYFKYSTSAELIDRYSYTQAQWESQIKQELDQKRPLYYSGFGSAGGHAFNCDGYKTVGSTTSYHFNWGWGGSQDGWFDINNVNGFNDGQAIIINSFPGSGYPYNCSGMQTLTTENGVFEDGSGNLNYQPNLDCKWLISPLPNPSGIDHVELKFDRFELTDAADVVTIYDGESTSAAVIASFNGNQPPVIGQVIKSTAEKVLVSFTTNGSGNGDGWHISYSVMGKIHCSGITNLYEPDYSFDDGSGALYNYSNNTTCKWQIHPSNATYIKLKFNSLQTELNKDRIYVYKELSAVAANLLGTYSGNTIPDTITSPTGKMLIVFATDGKNTFSGWSATYISDGVGQNIVENNMLNNINLFPNPAENTVKISFESNTSQNFHLMIYDAIGNCVYKKEIYDHSGIYESNIDVKGFSKGIYIVHIKSVNGAINRKLVID